MEFTIITLYPPIGLATVVSCILFGFAWRAHREEERTGNSPWWFSAGALLYLGALGTFGYLHGRAAIDGPFALFMTALIGQAMGVGCLFALWRAAYGKHEEGSGGPIVAWVQAGGFLAILLAGFAL